MEFVEEVTLDPQARVCGVEGVGQRDEPVVGNVVGVADGGVELGR